MTLVFDWAGQWSTSHVGHSGTYGVNLRDDASLFDRLAQTPWRSQLLSALGASWKEYAPRRTLGSLFGEQEYISNTLFRHDQHGRPRRTFAAPSLADILAPAPSEEEFRVLVTYQWEGTVRVVEEDYLEVVLVPAHEDGPEITADISTDVVDDDDIELIAPGAAFYLTLGKHPGRGGRHVSTQSLRFRRLGKWTTEEVSHFAEAGRKWQAAFDFDDTD